MSQGAQLGQSIGDWTITQVLTQNQGSGLYRATGPKGSRIVKELLLPPNLSPEQQIQRRGALLMAVSDWQNLAHPRAIEVQEVVSLESGIYLVLPELEGTTLAVHCQKSGPLPGPGVIRRWADELASLVEGLLELKHPLAFELLHPESILLDGKNHLLVFNPGWSKLLWESNQGPEAFNIQLGLSKFGKIVALLATGKDSMVDASENSSADLLWILSRCLSDAPGRRYENFSELRRGLRSLAVQGEEAQAMRPLGAVPPVAGFRIPSWQRLTSSPKRTYALSAVLLIGFIGLVWLYLHWLQPPPATRPALAVSVGDQIYLLGNDQQLRRAWDRFPQNIVTMAASPGGQRLYLGLEGATSLSIIDTDSGARHTVEIPASIRSLQISPDGLELLLILNGGRILRMDLRSDREQILDSAVGPEDTNQIAVVPLERAVSAQDHSGHMEGMVSVSPALGLVLLDATQGRNVSQWARRGVNSAVALPSGDVLTATEDGLLHILSPDLSRERDQSLPQSGPCQIYLGPDQSSFYSLQSGIGEGIVAFWKLYPEITLESQIHLPYTPHLASVDQQGKLWVVSDRREVFKIDPELKTAEQMARLTGQPQSIAYLASKSKPTSLDKLKDLPRQ